MKTLETEFKQDGYYFTQEKREGLVALYSKSKRGDYSTSYEVVILKENPPYKMKICKDGKPQEIEGGDCESYPRSEKWGVSGWTYSDRESAVTKFESLTR